MSAEDKFRFKDTSMLTKNKQSKDSERTKSSKSIGASHKMHVSLLRKELTRGLINKGNDCWLNSLLQCLHALKVEYPETTTKCNPTVVKVLNKTLRILKNTNDKPLYPQQLHDIFNKYFGYASGQQHDIHESFIVLHEHCDAGSFRGTYKYRKICDVCGKTRLHDEETFMTLFASVDNGNKTLTEKIEESLIDSVFTHCSTCSVRTNHVRIGELKTLPKILCLGFKRFVSNGSGVTKSCQRVPLPLKLTLQNDGASATYQLSSCALHYGSGIDVGHYTAVIFKDGRVYEVDDTFVSDISQKWKQRCQLMRT
ncbi:ubiquitin carboxyl-terminal hydrolase 17-like protein C [Xenia sp. Carnegie-2017]|uniref:ubiquitin carboxyl-terminal hydrolase 17-like protein C n=1 Tax=Xenia sp. Carnegie-2017 TaxID=2897299 RepID=UPI001F04E71B|nr:ubiquitin carboxyl-terminal hydrolase 17-like protein C [Xenia sp. Carnegie-2017]